MADQIAGFLSVALCTYNGERFLQDQLNSILRQTVRPGEMVVCDDCSVDRTLSILKAFEAAAPFPVQIKSNEHRLGAAGNFMQAIALCRYEWVLLSDQDDYWLENRIALFQAEIQANPDARIIQSDGLILRDGQVQQHERLWRSHHLSLRDVQMIQTGHAEKLLLRQVFLTGAAMAVSRRFAVQVPDPAPGFLHDEWLGWFAGNHIRLLQTATFLYRQHEQQVTGVDNASQSQLKRLLRPNDHSSVSLSQAIEKYHALSLALAEPSSEISAVIRRQLEDKIQFLKKRSQYSRSIPVRLFQICGSLLCGHYRLYSNGWRSLLKDLLQTDRL